MPHRVPLLPNKLPQEVRDDCRGDRSITRAALITIAKKKQARAMTTAYIAFKRPLKIYSSLSPRRKPGSRRS